MQDEQGKAGLNPKTRPVQPQGPETGWQEPPGIPANGAGAVAECLAVLEEFTVAVVGLMLTQQPEPDDPVPAWRRRSRVREAVEEARLKRAWQRGRARRSVNH